jgi:uncharacterized protein YlxW (UPF0749 family)
MKQYLIDNLDHVFAYLFGAGGLFSFWIERKKKKTDALSGMQIAYDKFVEDSDKKFEEMKNEVSTLKSKIEQVEASWRQKYNSLKREFDIYKKTHP